MGSKCCRIALWAEHAVGCLGWTVHQAAGQWRRRKDRAGLSQEHQRMMDGRSWQSQAAARDRPAPSMIVRRTDPRLTNGPQITADQCRVQQRFRATRGGFPRPSGVMADLASKRSTAAAVAVSTVQQPPALTRGRRSVEARVGTHSKEPGSSGGCCAGRVVKKSQAPRRFTCSPQPLLAAPPMPGPREW